MSEKKYQKKGVEKISIREYARRIGVTHTSVLKAIAAGKIVKGYDSQTKKIIPEIADTEYTIGNVNQTLKIKESVNQKAGNPEGAEFSQSKLDSLSSLEVSEIQILPGDTAAEAHRKQLIIKAQLDLLKLKTESGELVNKAETYKDLFDLAKEIRMNLQAIPERIIDQLVSLERKEAQELLLEAINETLEGLVARGAFGSYEL